MTTRLSAEEKRTKLLELFHETSDVFQLKDLERIAPKEKGIVQQAVKTTLQELVDNGDVHSEKIAGSIYFWAFPSEVLHNTKTLLAESEQENAKLTVKMGIVRKQLIEAAVTLKTAPEAAVLEKEIDELKKEKADLEKQVAASKDEMDYEEVAAKKQNAEKIIGAANRWTDNIYSIKMWCKKKFDRDDRELNKAFGIPDDLDYLEK